MGGAASTVVEPPSSPQPKPTRASVINRVLMAGIVVEVVDLCNYLLRNFLPT
jgi:hypothetical protein